MEKIGITTVQQLLDCGAEEIAKQLRVRYIDAELVEEWQAQADLVCRMPNLHGHDAQILVACGYDQLSKIAAATINELLDKAVELATSREGKRILRSSAAPDREEIGDWIEWATMADENRRAA